MLLIVVIMVWGAIGFKIWSGLNNHVAEQIVQNSIEEFSPKNTIVADAFSIQEVSRDPFLGTIKRKASTPKKRIFKQPIEWIPIVYKGLIKNTKTKQQVYVVQINNMEHLLKRGNVIEGVTLIKGDSKNIVVGYKGAQKTIEIKE